VRRAAIERAGQAKDQALVTLLETDVQTFHVHPAGSMRSRIDGQVSLARLLVTGTTEGQASVIW
jgi:hypothetical protein